MVEENEKNILILFIFLFSILSVSAQQDLNEKELKTALEELKQNTKTFDNQKLKIEIDWHINKAQEFIKKNNLEEAIFHFNKAQEFYKGDFPEQIEEKKKKEKTKQKINRPIDWHITTLVITIVTTLLLFINQKLTKSLTVISFSLILLLMIYKFFQLAYPSIPFAKNITVSTGYVAFIFLCISLLIGPLARITKKKFFLKLLPHRRNIGIIAFILALTHSITSLIYHYVKPPFGEKFFNMFFREKARSYVLKTDWFRGFGLGEEWFIFSVLIGAIALIGLFILSITSFNLAIKKLGSKLWKNTHRFIYLIMLLASIHIAFYRFVPKARSEVFLDNSFIIIMGLIILSVIIFQLIGRSVTKKTIPQKIGINFSQKYSSILTIFLTLIISIIILILILTGVYLFLKP